MPEIVRMPKMSDTMEEGVLVKWLKKEGDLLKVGDILAEVETDKAVMELENYEPGTLLHVAVKEGDKIPVDGLIAVIGEVGENIDALLNAPSQPAPAPATPVATPVAAPAPAAPAAAPAAAVTPATPAAAHRLKVSPLAKKMAEAQGIDLHTVVGSGDAGRIIKRDLEKSSFSADVPVVPGSPSAVEHHIDIPVSQMRGTIAKRLSASKYTAPHFYLQVEVEVSQLVQARACINQHAPTKVSFNDFILHATAKALRKNLRINSSWQGDHIREYQHIHVGVAVAVPDGLLVPVVRFTDTKGLAALSGEVKGLVKATRERTLQPEQWAGSTFAISNLGMYGIGAFTAIINTPNACILAIGGMQDKPVVRDGEVVPGTCMQLTLSCDHRVVDGATGATFLQYLKTLLEEPVTLLL